MSPAPNKCSSLHLAGQGCCTSIGMTSLVLPVMLALKRLKSWWDCKEERCVLHTWYTQTSTMPWNLELKPKRPWGLNGPGEQSLSWKHQVPLRGRGSKETSAGTQSLCASQFCPHHPDFYHHYCFSRQGFKKQTNTKQQQQEKVAAIHWFLRKLGFDLPQVPNPAISLLGTHPQDAPSCHKDTCSTIFMAT